MGRSERPSRHQERGDLSSSKRLELLENDVDWLQALFWRVVAGIATAVVAFLGQIAAIIATRGH